LPTIGLEVSLAAGSLGSGGEQGHAPSFFAGDVDFPSRTTARARLRPTAAPATLSGAAVAGKGVHSK
jgi:hypothetical protein